MDSIIRQMTSHRMVCPELRELYALLMAHYAVRRVMLEAAVELDPGRLSFTHALNVLLHFIYGFVNLNIRSRP